MGSARRSARERGRSDPVDAESVARVVLREPDLLVRSHTHKEPPERDRDEPPRRAPPNKALLVGLRAEPSAAGGRTHDCKPLNTQENKS
ncbi:hypothetical protein C5746_32650 [Streptomyces atratus]|uniref:Uncharacterized protein n=1 Tax=Streptomyces atratus TaxID=1893 RepID=A0A2Z5JKQ3_STRAR|nr:hypothetical protein C5746_32650 [Streptomyces atratus]